MREDEIQVCHNVWREENVCLRLPSDSSRLSPFHVPSISLHVFQPPLHFHDFLMLIY